MSYRRVAHVLITMIAVLASLFPVVAAAAAPTAAAPPWFVGQVGGATQVVGVTGEQSGRATVEVWGKVGEQWWNMTGALPGWVGSAGTAPQAKDGYPATPTGVFSLPEAFGTDPPPRTALPYHRVGPNDWWAGDVNSPATYNTHQVCAPGSCPFKEQDSERLAISPYALAVVMGVNPRRTPGGGGAFFLHVQTGGPTAGCVSIDKAALANLIAWLKPGAVIAIRKG